MTTLETLPSATVIEIPANWAYAPESTGLVATTLR
ncbi:Uncharacterised protein [Vibrio cholerae]|nr:Uncharacterised protein [Vibrio cholerae]